jgi:hypothetical protein
MTIIILVRTLLLRIAIAPLPHGPELLAIRLSRHVIHHSLLSQYQWWPTRSARY